MRAARRTMGYLAPIAVLSCFLACASASAQGTADEAAAREYFERGRVAFEEADYEAALVYFRHAYRLSRRGELQYDIGVAASRLQREEEALEAFENYLEETEQPEREAEVRERIAALRRSIAERKATERALAEAVIRYQTPPPPSSRHKRVSTSAIVGGSILAAIGVAGVTAMGIGIARDGSCAQAVGGRCITERAATGWTYAYGSIGVAALAGSAVWLGVDARAGKKARGALLRIGPTGIQLAGNF